MMMEVLMVVVVYSARSSATRSQNGISVRRVSGRGAYFVKRNCLNRVALVNSLVEAMSRLAGTWMAKRPDGLACGATRTRYPRRFVCHGKLRAACLKPS